MCWTSWPGKTPELGTLRWRPANTKPGLITELGGGLPLSFLTTHDRVWTSLLNVLCIVCRVSAFQRFSTVSNQTAEPLTQG